MRPEQVIGLAPDAASVGPGLSLAVASTWSSLGTSDAAVWGGYRGSGTKTYRVIAEPDQKAYRCSCPSRKIPCKHALGLLMLWARGEVPAGPELSLEERRESLQALSLEVAACTRCAELVAYRTQTVFGVGNPQTRLCFFGEAPGADEDRLGEPFVGRAGQLLDKIIEACGMRREDVYIMNILRCRPPGNRNPLPAEAANCREYLDRQLDVIQAEFICCLGAVAAQNLLETTLSIGRLRGRFHDLDGIKVMCTYHPAYLLRNPAAKKPTWEDIQFLMAEMGLKK